MARGVDVMIEANIDVRCAVCGADLDADFDGRYQVLTVEPCETCLQAARDEEAE